MHAGVGDPFEEHYFASRLLERGLIDLARLKLEELLQQNIPVGLRVRCELDLKITRLRELIRSEKSNAQELSALVENFDRYVKLCHIRHTELDTTGEAPKEADAYFMAERSAYAASAWARYYLAISSPTKNQALLQEASVIFSDLVMGDERSPHSIGLALCQHELGDTPTALSILDKLILETRSEKLKLRAGIARAEILLRARMYEALEVFVKNFLKLNPKLAKSRRAGELYLYLSRSYGERAEEFLSYGNKKKSRYYYDLALREAVHTASRYPRATSRAMSLIEQWAENANLRIPPDVVLARAEYYFKIGKYPRAIKLFEELLDTDYSDYALSRLARCCYATGDYPRTLELLKKLPELSRGELILYIDCLKRAGSSDQSLRGALEKYLKKFGDTKETEAFRLALAEDLISRSRYAEGLEVLQAHFKSPEHTYKKLLLASRAHLELFKLGKKAHLQPYISALKSLIKLTKDEGERFNFTIALAEVYLACEPPQTEKSLELLDALPLSERSGVRSKRVVLKARIVRGEYQEASLVLNSLLSSNEHSKEDGLLAFVLATRILENPPKDIRNHRRTALTYLLWGFSLTEPPDRALYGLTADLCFELKEHRKAKEFYALALKYSPSPIFKLKLAKVSYILGDYRTAYELLSKLKRNLEGELYFGISALRIGRLKEGEESLKLVASRSPLGSARWATAQFELASLYLKTDREELASRFIELGLSLAPDDWRAKFSTLKKLSNNRRNPE